MRPGKIRRLRNIIAGRSYLRDRAIQMGEQLGAWHAEWALSGFDRLEAMRKAVMFSERMEWYVKKALRKESTYSLDDNIANT